MVYTLKRYTLKDHVKEFRAILYEPEKVKEGYEFWLGKIDFKDFKFKYYKLIDNPQGSFDYNGFLFRCFLVYNIYNKVRTISSFNGLIKKLVSFSAFDVNGFASKSIKFFDFSKKAINQRFQHSIIYVVAKWLGLAPNKDFKPVFEKVSKDLRDKVWWK